jgi:hypothetical protein
MFSYNEPFLTTSASFSSPVPPFPEKVMDLLTTKLMSHDGTAATDNVPVIVHITNNILAKRNGGVKRILT